MLPTVSRRAPRVPQKSPQRGQNSPKTVTKVLEQNKQKPTHASRGFRYAPKGTQTQVILWGCSGRCCIRVGRTLPFFNVALNRFASTPPGIVSGWVEGIAVATNVLTSPEVVLRPSRGRVWPRGHLECLLPHLRRRRIPRGISRNSGENSRSGEGNTWRIFKNSKENFRENFEGNFEGNF